jgi:hypothetical protein
VTGQIQYTVSLASGWDDGNLLGHHAAASRVMRPITPRAIAYDEKQRALLEHLRFEQ